MSVADLRAEVEEVDVVIVGSRCAGSAAAIALARRGKRVIALDRAHFPSDTLSTHLFFPSHWAEIERLGATARVRALDPPLHHHAGLGAPGVTVAGPYNPVDGINYGSCVRRSGLDLALVETAREAGAEVREGIRVTGLVTDDGGRVSGVRWRDQEGAEGVIASRLVIGADGRHSSVAKMVGTTAHHEYANQRMMAYAYFDDPAGGDRNTAMQWRIDDRLGTIFPCDGDQSLVLLMPPVSHADDFRADLDGTYDRGVAAIPQLAERLNGCTRRSKVRISVKHPSYYRHSHGPGWALTGDAGHFKDPVIAQGIRDALRFGRLLGEAVAPALEAGPAAVDAAVLAWEHDRDEQCFDSYQWGNSLGAPDDVSPIEASAYAWLADHPDRPSELLDIFSRRRKPNSMFNTKNLFTWLAQAMRDPSIDNRTVATTLKRDIQRELGRRQEKIRFRRRRDAADRRRSHQTITATATATAAAAAAAAATAARQPERLSDREPSMASGPQ